jgi:tetratricopeptide (TPR) repeat protein
MASVAPRGSILADADSLGPELAFFEASPVEHLTLAGRDMPVSAVCVQGLSRVRRRIDASYTRGLSPFLGRDALLAELVQNCTQAERRSRVVEVRGPAGIGKTRLLDELAAHLSRQGIVTLRGGCESYGLTPVLEPFRQLLATQALATQPQAAGISGGDAPDIRERSLSLLVEHDDDRCVLLLDDWHWADDASRRLLDDVLNANTTLRVVVASREVEGSVAHARAPISPQPLTHQETNLIVQALVPGINPFLVDELHEYAGGVPLFVEEVCHMLRDRGEAAWQFLRRSAPRARSSSGGWMRSMMAARVEGLDERVWNTAQAAAVAGLRVPRWLLEDLVPGGLDDQVLNQLAKADLLYPDGSDALRFRHGLSRDALYDLIPLQRRTTLHRQSLSLLESKSSAERDPAERLEALAHHAWAAGEWSPAIQFCEAAGEHAMRLGAFDNARRQFFAAIEAAEYLGVEAPADRVRWCTLIHRLAMTCTFDPLQLPQALPLMERCVQAARELGGGELLARSLYWEAYLRFVFGQPRRAVALAKESKALTEALGSTRLFAQLNATLGQALAAVCSYPEALDALHTALQVKQANAQHRGTLAIGSAYTLACVAGVHADRGDFNASHAALAQARELVAGHPNHPIAYSVRTWEVSMLAWQQRWEDALEGVESTVELAHRLRAWLPLAIARAVGGYARWRLRLEPNPQAITEAIEAVRWMENHQVHFYTPLYYGWLVEMAVDAGRIDEARRWAVEVLRRARTGERIGEAVVWRALARLARQQGDRPRAWRRLARAEISARTRQSSREAALNQLLKAQLLQDDMRPSESAQLHNAALEQMAAMGLGHASHAGALVSGGHRGEQRL